MFKQNQTRTIKLTQVPCKWLYASVTMVVGLSAGFLVSTQAAYAATPNDAMPVSQQVTSAEEKTDPDEETAGSKPETQSDKNTGDDPADSKLGTGEKGGTDESTTPAKPVTTPKQTAVETKPAKAVETKSDFSYTQDENGTYIVTGYTGESQQQADGSAPQDGYATAITIPDTYMGKAVTGIAANAFNNVAGNDNHLGIVKALTAVTLGANIQWVGAHAFAHNNLTSLTLPNSTWSLKAGAFEDNQLTTVELNRVEQIDEDAFAGNKLTKVVIPETTTGIGNRAFNQNAITQLTLGDKLQRIGTSAFADNQIGGNLTLPTTLINLGDAAFQKNRLTGISLDDNLQTIGTDAFNTNLIAGNVVLPTALTELGAGSFANNHLTGVTFNSAITKINNGVFENNEFSGILKLPDSVENIGDRAFANNRLTGVDLGPNVTTIGTSTFTKNQLAGTLEMPANLTSIGDGAFSFNQLTGIGWNDQTISLGKSVFAHNYLKSTLVIPKTIVNIGDRDFYANALTGLIIDNPLESLGNEAFAYNNLQDIQVTKDIGTSGDGAYAHQKALTGVTVTIQGLKASGVKTAIAKRLGLPVSKLADLQFKLNGEKLTYDEYSDTLILPVEVAYEDQVDLSLSSTSTDTGRYGVDELLLELARIPDLTPPDHDPSTDPSTDPSKDPTTDPTTDPSTDPSTDPTTDPTTPTDPVTPVTPVDPTDNLPHEIVAPIPMAVKIQPWAVGPTEMENHHAHFTGDYSWEYATPLTTTFVVPKTSVPVTYQVTTSQVQHGTRATQPGITTQKTQSQTANTTLPQTNERRSIVAWLGAMLGFMGIGGLRRRRQD